MRPAVGNALRLVAVVLLAGAVGAGVLLATGSDIGVGLAGIGVPLVVAIGIAVYVQMTINQNATTPGEFVHDRARSAATTFRDEVTAYNRRRSQHPEWETGRLDTQVDQLVDDFAAAGVTVSPDDGTFEVDEPSNPREFDSLEEAVSEFARQRDAAFEEFVESELRRADDALDRLAPDVLAAEEVESVPPSATPSDPDDAAATLSEARETARDTVERAANRVEETIQEYDGDPATIRESLEQAESAAADGNIETAVAKIEQATSAAEAAVGEAFDDRREAVEALVETVDQSVVETYVDREHVDAVREVGDEISDVDTAMDRSALEDAERRLREHCRAMVEQLQSDLDANIETIQRADIPVGFYTVPAAAGHDYTGQLRSAEDLSAFRTTWVDAVGALTDAVETATEKASVADSYGMIADEIDETLRTTGRVEGSDLRVASPAQFMELYADANPEVEYDPSGPTLSAPGGSETYTLTVTARLADNDGSQYEFRLDVDGESDNRTARATDYVATRESFERLPYGEYEVTATVDDGAFPTVSETVRVTADTELELAVERQSVADRVCGRDRDDVRDQLPTVAGELERTFDRESHLVPEMEFPVTDEYVPCLLALWAEETDHDARIDDGRVLVYDHDELVERVEHAVRQSVVDGGETLAFETIRSRYLSVPVSDDLLETVVRGAGLDVTVESGEVTPA
jgi:hypothetical protein